MDDVTRVSEQEAEQESSAEELSPQQWSHLSERPWPQFPSPSIISQYNAEFIYQASCGIHGLVKILNRSIKCAQDAEDYEDAENHPLHPVDEEYLWCGLIALSGKLAECIDEWHAKVMDADNDGIHRQEKGVSPEELTITSIK